MNLIKTQKQDDFDFAGELIQWLGEGRGLDHIALCFHEGSHVLYARELGFSPEVFGPDPEDRFYPGLGWRRMLGSVQGLPMTIQMGGNALLVAKQFLGPRYVEEKMLGKHMSDEIWEGARFDLQLYNQWRALRQKVVGDVEFLRAEDVRKSVFRDFERPQFLKLLLDTAREYERRVSKLPDCKIK